MGKLRLRELQELGQSATGNKGQSWIQSQVQTLLLPPDSLASDPEVFFPSFLTSLLSDLRSQPVFIPGSETQSLLKEMDPKDTPTLENTSGAAISPVL